MKDIIVNENEIVALMDKYSKSTANELGEPITKFINSEINSDTVSLFNEEYNNVIFRLIEKY